MTTIAFYGDSFCASDRQDSWCVLLANQLKCEIKRFGIGGSSIWNTFLEFEKDRGEGLADYLIFCWTDSHRLYHPSLPLTPGNKPIPGTDPAIWNASENYYKYLSYQDKDNIAYKYALQFFDQNVLGKYEHNKNIVQMWSMLPFDIKLQSGVFVNESCLIHSWDGDQDFKGQVDPNLSNHMTVEQNKTWANKVFGAVCRKQ